ncbi:hypothetical protein J4Q44_G00003310 [Coregonus suidteri]|uniref:BZIP domain-containing protein n=1 Tax=Coregonus suidteri TaxID=861788 RepID=A0AAN8R8R5_9TELE
MSYFEIPEIFKALLEDPFTIPTLDSNDNDKEKLLTGDNVDLEGGSGMGPSAALTPAIWDKTIPYNGETFHLEKTEKPTTMAAKPKTAPAAPISLLPILELDQCEEEVTITLNSVDIADDTEVVTDKDRLTPEPIDPEEIEVDVNFEPDPTDLVLSSVPGGELFNPRKHKFSEEELKPQPMIKKAKKVYVPEDSKDEKYWHRRKKNNVAAKRSRDARRLKENQITVRAAFLERENTALRQEVGELRKDFSRSKNVVARYAAKFGALAPLEDQ